MGPTGVAAAHTFTVSGTSDPASPACAGTVCASLRAAVAAANASPGSTIQLDPATYTLSQGQLQLTADMAITGAGAAVTTIHQTAANRVLFASATAATIDITGLTVSGGDLT